MQGYMKIWGLLQYIDHLLKEVDQLWKLPKIVEGEHDVAIWELSLSNVQLATKRVRMDMVESSLAVMSAHLDKNAMKCAKLHHPLAEA